MESLGRKRVNKLIVATLSAGIVLVAVSVSLEVLFGAREADRLYVMRAVLRIASGLGEAMVIAGLIAFGFERVLSEERMREFEDMLRSHHRLRRFGFRATYANRQEIFDEIFERQLSITRDELKIMGICVSLFRESDRSSSTEKRLGRQQVVETISSRIQAGCTVQVLILKRYPTPEELCQYGVEHVDLYYVREHDEDIEEEFMHGKRLKKMANRSLDGWIQVLLLTARKIKALKADDRRRILSRLQVREYLAIPSLSLYILDERIYVTPYLFKRHCSRVPSFQVGDRESPLYKEYHAHFSATWIDRFTTPAIPVQFTNLLVEDPERTLIEFEKKYAAIRTAMDNKVEKDPAFGEGPEYWRASEMTIREMLGNIEGAVALDTPSSKS